MRLKRPRRSTSARGYGSAHQATRKRLELLVRMGGYLCRRCGREIRPGEQWHLDHSDDRSTYLGASHAYCNTTAPHRRLPELPPVTKTSRDWYGGKH